MPRPGHQGIRSLAVERMRAIFDGLTNGQRREEKHKHPCAGCGRRILQKNVRCRDCHFKVQVMPTTLSHGFTRGGIIHPVHRVWREMFQRCTNPKNKRYARYGGRGISVDPRWLKFETFLADVGPRPEGQTPGGRAAYSIDRFPNPNGNYELGNVRWATTLEQARNK